MRTLFSLSRIVTFIITLFILSLTIKIGITYSVCQDESCRTNLTNEELTANGCNANRPCTIDSDGNLIDVKGSIVFDRSKLYLPDDLTIKLPFAGTHKVNAGYTVYKGSTKHKGLNRSGNSNDYYGIDFDVKYRNEVRDGNGTLLFSQGDPVLAVASGTVKYAGVTSGGWSSYGKIVIIEHAYNQHDRYYSLYAHLSEIKVSVNQYVKQGKEISRGTAPSANHLHFALYRNSKAPLGKGPYGGQAVIPEPLSGYYGIDYYWDNPKVWWLESDQTPPDQTLARIKNQPEVYWLQNGKAYHVLTPQIIETMNELPGWGIPQIIDYRSDVFVIKASGTFPESGTFTKGPDFINITSDGLLIRLKDDQKVYLIKNGQRRWISSAATFDSLGYNWNDVIDITPEIVMLADISEGDPIENNYSNISLIYPEEGETVLSDLSSTFEWESSNYDFFKIQFSNNRDFKPVLEYPAPFLIFDIWYDQSSKRLGDEAWSSIKHLSNEDSPIYWRVKGKDGLDFFALNPGYSSVRKFYIEELSDALTITTSSLPGGEVGQAYSVTLSATGGVLPYTWRIDSGSLPVGLTFGSSAGKITGIPIEEGYFDFTVEVVDSNLGSVYKELSIEVAPEVAPHIDLLTPEEEAVLPTQTSPSFQWESVFYDFFKIQFSQSSDFSEYQEYPLHILMWIRENEAELDEQAWTHLKNLSEDDAPVFWRVKGTFSIDLFSLLPGYSKIRKFYITDDVVSTTTTAQSAPHILSISPTSHEDGTFDLFIYGNNFDSGAVDEIYWKADGHHVGQGTVLSRSSTRLRVREYMESASAGTYVLKVRNSDGTLSNGAELQIKVSSTIPTTTTPTTTTTTPITSTTTTIQPSTTTTAKTSTTSTTTSVPRFNITSISPSTAQKGTTVTFTLSGSGFQSNFRAEIINELGDVYEISDREYVNSTRVRVRPYLGCGPTSTQYIKIINPDGQNDRVSFAALGCVTTTTTTRVTPLNITSISPSTAQKGTTVTFTLSGSGFQSNFRAEIINELGDVYEIGDKEYVNSTRVRVSLYLGCGPTSTQHIKIINRDGQDDRISFTAIGCITTTTTAQSVPYISSISPTSHEDSTFDLYIYGSGFDNGAVDQIYWKEDGHYVGQGTVLSRSSTQLRVREYMTGASPGTYLVKVKNSNGSISNEKELNIYCNYSGYLTLF